MSTAPNYPFPTQSSVLKPQSSAKSLRPIFDQLQSAGSNLDDILKELDLSKEESEQLLASQKYTTHRQLRTDLLAQQLQLIAQDHAHHAINRLLNLTDSPHPAIARLAATQLLTFAGLNTRLNSSFPQKPGDYRRRGAIDSPTPETPTPPPTPTQSSVLSTQSSPPPRPLSPFSILNSLFPFLLLATCFLLLPSTTPATLTPLSLTPRKNPTPPLQRTLVDSPIFAEYKRKLNAFAPTGVLMRVKSSHILLTAALTAAGFLANTHAQTPPPISQPASDGSPTLAQRLLDDAVAQGRDPNVDPSTAAKESVILLQSATRLEPSNALALKLLIQATAATHQDDLRRDALRKLIKLDPGDLVAQVQYIDYLASAKQSLDEREKVYAAIFASKTLNPQIRSRMAVRLAGIAQERGDRTAAAADLQQALALDDTNVDALRAVLNLTKGPLPNRLAAAVNLLTADPYEPSAWIEGARTLAAANLHSRASDFLIIAIEQLQLAGASVDAELYLDLGIELAAAGRFPEAFPIAANLSQLSDSPLSALLAAKLLSKEYAPPVFAPKAAQTAVPDIFTNPTLSPTTDTAPATQADAADLPDLPADSQPATATAPATQSSADTQPASQPVLVDTLSNSIRARLAAMIAKNPNSPATLAEALWIEFSMLPSTPDSDAVSADWFKTYRQLNASGDMTELARLSGWGLLRIGKLDQAQAILEKNAPADPMSELGLARVYLAQNKRPQAAQALQDIWNSHPTGLFALQTAQTARLANIKLNDTPLTQEISAVLARMPTSIYSAHRQVRDTQLVVGQLAKSRVDLGEPAYMHVSITNVSNRPLSVGDNGAIKTRVGLTARSRGMGGTNLGLYTVIDLQRTFRLEPREQIEQNVRVDCGALADLFQSNPIRDFTAGIRIITAPRGMAETPAIGLGGQEVTIDDLDRSGVLLHTSDDYRHVVEDAATLTGDKQLIKIQLVAMLLNFVPEQVGPPSQDKDDIAKAALREQIIGAIFPLCSSPSPIIRAWILRVLPYTGLGDKLDAAIAPLKTDPDPSVRMMWGWRLLQTGVHLTDLRNNATAELNRLKDTENDPAVKTWLATLSDDLAHQIELATRPVAAAPTPKPAETQPDQNPVTHQVTPDTTILHPNDNSLAPP